MPDYHDMKGGSEWGNNGKSIIICHREFDSKVLEVKINKAKPEIVGIRGLVMLEYDIVTGKYYTNDIHKGKIYATPLPRETAMQNNMNF